MHPKRCSSCPPPPCKKRPVRRTCWQSPIWSTILAVLAGLAVVLLLLLLFSLLISNVDASEELVAAMGCVSLCAGSFTAGFVAAKRRRCKGLLIGLACGIAMYLVTFLIGLLLLQRFAAGRNIFQADFYGSVQLYRRGGRREYQMPCATLLKNWQESNQKNLCAIVQYVKFFCESAKAIENKGGLCYNSSYPLRTISSRGFHAVSKAKSKCRTVSMFDREDFCYEAHQDHQ